MKRVVNQSKSVVVTVLVVLAIVVVGVVSAVSYYSEDKHVACEVTDKDRTKDNEGNSDARVYTRNCGTFQVSDSLIKGEFNSGDTFGSIEAGKVYDFSTIGYRFGLFSMFPNIVDVNESE